MKTSTYKYILLFGFLGFLLACSTKKDTAINRNYHALTTKYNVLYNGNIALAEGIEELKTTYEDNYWDILPVERMQPVPEQMGPTEKKNPKFERAEEKATKAIQKHSMYMGGTERNPQMDEAHLLLGKARYYENRFIPALEALNYILYKYPTSDRINEVKVWREKTNIRLDNENVAIKNLKEVIKQKDIDDEVYSDANAMLAAAYMKTESADSALTVLKEAIKFTRNNEKKARYLFITGQINDRLKAPDSAYAAFQQVIDMKRKSPRRYVIQAHAMQASQFDFKNGDTLAFMEKYNDLLEDRENRPYLDIINFQVGLFYDKQDLDDNAIKYYNKSLRSQSKDKYMRASSHRNIAEIHFENAKYQTAGKYYDSTLVFLEPRTREFLRIRKKRNNLEDVIKYEGIAQTNDSILRLVAMAEPERIAYFEDYIAKLKEQEEKERERLEAEARRAENMGGMAGNAPSQMIQNDAAVMRRSAGGPAEAPGTRASTISSSAVSSNAAGAQGGGKFPFYTPATVAFGKLEFQKRWGNRPHVDNWRWSSELRNLSRQDEEVAEELSEEEQQELEARFTPEFYIAQIPTDKGVIDTLAIDRNFAYYQLGLIYKEKFREYKRAADKLEKLLVNEPEERLILPSLYNLYKIYEIIDPAKAEVYKQRVYTEYPDSRYAEIIRNPASEIENNESPEAVYTALYKQAEEDRHREVLPELEERIELYTGEEIVSKFELLKATVTGRLQGLEEYKNALNFVALNYPNSDEGKQAEVLLKTDVVAMEKLNFGAPAITWKILFKFDKDDPKAKALTEKIQKYIKEGLNNRITITKDTYNLTDDFLVVHGFNSKLAAQDAVSVLKEYKEYRIAETPYIISSEDYKVVQIKKNFTEFQAIK